MDGDKYKVEIINAIRELSLLDNTEEALERKRKVCIFINGESGNEKNLSKWNKNPSAGRDSMIIVFKQQFVHSSAAIYINLKYPQFRRKNSFIDIIINSGLEKECLKIASDVLNADEDCIDFITNSDFIFNSDTKINIVDEKNDRLISNY